MIIVRRLPTNLSASGGFTGDLMPISKILLDMPGYPGIPSTAGLIERRFQRDKKRN